MLLVGLTTVEIPLEAIANLQQGKSSKSAIETGGESDRDRNRTIHSFAPLLNKIYRVGAVAL